jgi:hypothetical protein
MQFRITQLFPRGFRSLPVTAHDTRDALDIVDMMIDRGATEIKIVDAAGRRYDLIELERMLDEEMARPGGLIWASPRRPLRQVPDQVRKADSDRDHVAEGSDARERPDFRLGHQATIDGGVHEAPDALGRSIDEG